MDFVPLLTQSGHPHLSNEQRQHFYNLKVKNMNVVSPLFDNKNYNALFGQYDNFQKWRVLDLQCPAIHPMHLVFLSIRDRLESLRDAGAKLEGEKANMPEEEWGKRRGYLNYLWIECMSNVDLVIKKEYKRMLAEIESEKISQTTVNALPTEECTENLDAQSGEGDTSAPE